MSQRQLSMPFIDQIIDDCVGHKALSFMDGFSSYNQIQIHQVDQYKTTFTTPWGTFSYSVMPFGLKNAGTTFQLVMIYIFHDLAHIILAYLDDLTTRSKKCTQHLPKVSSIQHPLEPPQVCVLRHFQAPPWVHHFPKRYYHGSPQSPDHHRNSTPSEFMPTPEPTRKS
jgi:hypothetical protein